MRIFHPVVQPLVLAMFAAPAPLASLGCMGFELVGDHRAGCFGRFLEKFPHELQCCGLVFAALNQNVENETVLINGAPKPMLSAAYRNDDLIKMPFAATSRGASAKLERVKAIEPSYSAWKGCRLSLTFQYIQTFGSCSNRP
jgi:hypothetical protein